MDDSSIINLYINRSEQAILETKKKYGRYCRTIARNILSNHLDVEECESDTYLATWNTIPPQQPKELKVFLGRIIRNIALDKYSYNTAKKRNKEFEVILNELEECIPANSTVEMEYEEGEIAKLMNQFLYMLEEEKRNLFIRRYWYSDSIAEIASRFHMSQSKVKSSLFRIRNKLKTYLEKERVQL